MVVAPLCPGRFYGSSLPRPRFYSDVRLNADRVDPPASVTEPLLLWAREAHWSMGGLSFQRLRLQGRIEGSIEKLRAQSEAKSRTLLIKKKRKEKGDDHEAPDPNPKGWVSEDDEGEEKVVPLVARGEKRARDIDAEELNEGIASRTRSRRGPPAAAAAAEKEVEKSSPEAGDGGRRKSPRKKNKVVV